MTAPYTVDDILNVGKSKLPMPGNKIFVVLKKLRGILVYIL